MIAVKARYNSIMYLYHTFVDGLIFAREHGRRKKRKVHFKMFFGLLVMNRTAYTGLLQLHHSVIDLATTGSAPSVSTNQTSQLTLAEGNNIWIWCARFG